MTESFHRLSLVDLAEQLRAGQIKAVDVTRHFLNRIESENPKWNIVVRLNGPAALERAKKLDELRDRDPGATQPLHGVPFTIKDVFRTKNVKTSYGVPGLQIKLGPDTCTLVQRLFDAGAVLLGQTNVPLACFDWQTNSPIYGLTRNPLDPSKTVGGSSGGSAASLAAGFTPFEVGSDIAGSIRYPSHCCGVYGFRPTHGWIPFSDTGPAFAKTSFANLAVAGPMARSLEDLMLALSVLAADNEGWQKGNGNLGIRQGPIRAAFTLSWNGIATDEKSSIRIQQFLNDLRVAGHEVREIEVPFDPVRLTELWGLIVGYEMRSKLPWLMRLPPMIQMFDHLFNRRRLREGHLMETVTSGFRATRKDYEAALKEAIQGRLDFSQKISKFDVWVTPVSSGPAVTHCAMGTRFDLRGKAVGYSEYLGNFLTPTTVLHNPILSAPLKSVRGELPINVQLQGQPGEDWKLLHQAKRMEGLFSNGLAIPG